MDACINHSTSVSRGDLPNQKIMGIVQQNR